MRMLLGMLYVVGVSEMIFSCHFLVYQDPNALKTGLNDPIDIQTKIADEGSSFIQEEASTDSTKTKFNEVIIPYFESAPPLTHDTSHDSHDS